MLLLLLLLVCCLAYAAARASALTRVLTSTPSLLYQAADVLNLMTDNIYPTYIKSKAASAPAPAPAVAVAKPAGGGGGCCVIS